MSYWTDLIMLLCLAGLLGASGFFSGTETAMFSLSAADRSQLARSRGLTAGLLLQLLEETRSLLITLMLGNMCVNVLYFVISTVLLIRLGEAGAGAAIVTVLSVAPLVVIILFGEVLPKLIASRRSLLWSRTVAAPLLLIHRVITPVRATLNWVVITPLARLIAPAEKPPSLSTDEIEGLLEMTAERGVITSGEEYMLGQVLALGSVKVSQIMTHRTDLVAFDLNEPPHKLVELATNGRFSRFPAYVGDIDHIEGMINAREVLLRPPESDEAMRALVRQVRFVPALQRADELLKTFRRLGITTAIAVDEYGGTAGMITLEDVVEPMVGEIADPGEGDQPVFERLGERTWRVDPRLPVRDWAALLGMDPAVLVGEQPLGTVGGLVMAQLGRLPRVGDHVRLANLKLTVEAMTGPRLQTVRITTEPSDAAPAGGDA